MAVFGEWFSLGTHAGALTEFCCCSVGTIGGFFTGLVVGAGGSAAISAYCIYPALKSINGVSPEAAAGITVAIELGALCPAMSAVTGLFGLFAGGAVTGGVGACCCGVCIVGGCCADARSENTLTV